MAQKTAVGVNGVISFITGHVLRFDRYSLAVRQALLPTTAFGDLFEVNTAGLKSGRFSASGHFVYDFATTAPGVASMSQTGGTVTFTIAPGCTEAVTCIIGEIAIENEVAGDARGTYSGVTSGAVTETWDELS